MERSRNCPPAQPGVSPSELHLNKLCFNGLWRVNSSNEFNVPYANLKNPTVLDEEALRTASKRLQHTTIRQQDFADCLADAAAGDWVYLDPPYIPLSPSSSFSRYAADDFTKPDHQRLADTIRDLINRGVNVTLSNSDTPTTREIYDALGSDWQIHSVQVRRSIGAKADTRTKVGEILACSYPLEDSHDPALAGRILGLGDEPEVEADEADTSPS